MSLITTPQSAGARTGNRRLDRHVTGCGGVVRGERLCEVVLLVSSVVAKLRFCALQRSARIRERIE